MQLDLCPNVDSTARDVEGHSACVLKRDGLRSTGSPVDGAGEGEAGRGECCSGRYDLGAPGIHEVVWVDGTEAAGQVITHRRVIATCDTQGISTGDCDAVRRARGACLGLRARSDVIKEATVAAGCGVGIALATALLVRPVVEPIASIVSVEATVIAPCIWSRPSSGPNRWWCSR